MNPISRLYPINRSRLFDGPLARTLSTRFAFEAAGYAWSTVRRYLVGIAHFAQWMRQARVTRSSMKPLFRGFLTSICRVAVVKHRRSAVGAVCTRHALTC